MKIISKTYVGSSVSVMNYNLQLKFALILLIPFFFFSFSSCTFLTDVEHPYANPGGILSQAIPLKQSSKNVMNGIYTVLEGKETFGEQVVLKWNENSLSVFTSSNAGYMVLQGGSLDSVIVFEGHWRFRTNTETGFVELHIPRGESVKKIFSGDTSLTGVIIKGSFGFGKDLPSQKLTLRYLRPFSKFVKDSDFMILAHRGGGRNSDFLGVSENTIEMISQAEGFGAHGIEIDVRLSNDNIPFLYHDFDINLRLTRNSVIWGDIEDFNYFQVRNLVTLKNGERIPTLKKALEYILEKTTLKFVWLDLKSDKNEIPVVKDLMADIHRRAVPLKRNLQIIIGIPTEDKRNQLKDVPGFRDIPSLCELSPDDVRELNSLYWAPRWTEGLQSDRVNQMQSEGKKVFVWTLDEQSFMQKYINEGNFNGVLTNYPSLAAYYHYIR